MSTYPYERTCVNAGIADGAGTTLDVLDDDHIIVDIYTTNNANLTLKCAGSIANTAPTFTSAQAYNNRFEYVEMINQQDSSDVLTGDTGLVLSGTDVVRQYMVNTEGYKWINFVISDHVAGTVYVYVRGFKRG